MSPKSDWTRTTNRKTLETIPAETRQAIEEHISRYGLALDPGDCLMCIETASIRKKGGLLSMGMPKKALHVCLLLPQWLVIAIHSGDAPGAPAVLSVPLQSASAVDHQDHPAARAVPDRGIHFTGAFTGMVGMHGSSQVTSFVPLGEEAAAEAFKALLFSTLAAAKQ